MRSDGVLGGGPRRRPSAESSSRRLRLRPRRRLRLRLLQRRRRLQCRWLRRRRDRNTQHRRRHRLHGRARHVPVGAGAGAGDRSRSRRRERRSHRRGRRVAAVGGRQGRTVQVTVDRGSRARVPRDGRARSAGQPQVGLRLRPRTLESSPKGGREYEGRRRSVGGKPRPEGGLFASEYWSRAGECWLRFRRLARGGHR